MIEIIHVKKSFEDKEVLIDINLTIPEGETMVIVGGSGCGKTVLLRAIIGLIKPDKGQIFVQDTDITKLNRFELFEIRKKFGMLFQGAALFDSMSVMENIALPLKEHTRLKDQEIRERVQETLELVGLPEIGEKKPSELSGGMKKRVGLARALIINPQYVLFDEPTTGLDPVMADAINHLIMDTNRRLNITSIVVTHDMNSAFKIADRMAMIHAGRVIYSDKTEAFRKAKHPILKRFIEGKWDGTMINESKE